MITINCNINCTSLQLLTCWEKKKCLEIWTKKGRKRGKPKLAHSSTQDNTLIVAHKTHINLFVIDLN